MLTDERIEELILAGGGRWHDKSFWKIEDADLHPTARAIEAEVRKEYTELIRQLVEALTTLRATGAHEGFAHDIATTAITAGRARLERKS